MILSIHLAEGNLGSLTRTPVAPGLIWGRTLGTVPLAAGLVPPPRPTGVALLAGWTDDAALDRFLAGDPLAERLAGGWSARLEPLRASGTWSALPGLNEPERPVDDGEPVAIVTLGRLRFRRARSFFRATARAERQAVEDPAVLLGTAMARPPRLLATFSVWGSAAAMRDYAYGRPRRDHVDAIREHRAEPFHHESIFARFRPYAAAGSWRGLSPLA